MRHLIKALSAPALFLVAACANDSDDPALADAFMAALNDHCGMAYEGSLVSTDEVDADFAAETLIMHVRDCDQDTIRVPLHVGEDRSRTWVMTRLPDGLRLKHDHRHEDGTEDAVTQYGGDASAGSITRVDKRIRAEFPVDAYSIALFEREGLTASVTNVWAIEIEEEALFAYELKRENRFFRAEFDLTKPVDAPPPPWGAEG